MRRVEGQLLPIEFAILDAGVRLAATGVDEFHGYLAAKTMRTLASTRSLTSHGTLYKALGRLEAAGMLASRWESPDIAAAAGRPRRRLYKVTVAGQRARARALQDAPERGSRRPRLSPAEGAGS